MTAKDKILKIENELGLTAKGMAVAMKISTKTFYNKKNEKILDHTFNDQNYEDLLNHLKNILQKITKDEL